MRNLFFLLLLGATVSVANSAVESPNLQLANKYHNQIDLRNYWVSEKYDGVRAFWNGNQLISRQGNIINAPTWFTAPLTAVPLDGELWLDRGKFDQLSGIIRRQSPVDDNWRNIKYMVFDLPNSKQVFDERLGRLRLLIKKINAPHIRLVEQVKISTHSALMQILDDVVASNGEGLMLHLGSSTYKNSRSDDLLKLKKYSDAEAIVIKHIPGKGNYKGLLGSILVEMADKKRFKIGSGFSLADRNNPPVIGSVITYKYFGLTNNGIPRFASFLRVRNDH
jgi:DNA ligase-1